MLLYCLVQVLRLIITWTVLLIWVSHCGVGSDGIYECGTHGRFEYCIDGIPGCVIGCHCHPGYYFDTDTKICEPNTKLTLNYRRHYIIPEPTRVQDSTFLSDVAQTESILTTHNAIDENVNDITRNADDLGDWLYNQFFKTIESQVINNTNKDNQLTRRSGRGSLPKHNKLKRRARQKGNRHTKKKKGLQGKLLRIAEDDSLFQSSDSSDSDTSSHSYSSRSYSSFESNSDEDHGHKKILLINKKPKPPLPSFIFLPNMNTPFYPPIGLPPPPVMPMYPMVPIPPMLPPPPPPLLPFQGHVHECDENTVTVTTAASMATTRTTEITIENITTTKSHTITTSTAQTGPASTDVPALRSHYKQRKRKKAKSLENIPDDDDEEPTFDIINPNQERRQKILKQLRQRLNRPRLYDPSVKRHRKPIDNLINQLNKPPETLIDNGLTDEIMPKNENSPLDNLEDTSELENVDFKYLSQLIHRVKDNQTRDAHVYKAQNSPKTIISPEWSKKRYHDFNVPLNSGRRLNLQQQMINSSKITLADDLYYSNLGRQIATLIRTIDADKEKVEIEKVQHKTNDNPYFSENGPRTFWERSVRSPIKFFHYFKTKFNNLKNSNELLFNIENKVETAVSTVPTLSLREIENMISVMDAARTQFQSNKKTKQSNTSANTLNVNLWPQEVRQLKESIKNFVTPNVLNIKRRKAVNYRNDTRPENFNNLLNKIEQQNLNQITDRVNVNKLNTNITQKPLKNKTKMYFQPMRKVEVNKIHDSAETHRRSVNPSLLNYKNFKKFFFDDNNHYSFQNDDLRLQYSPTKHLEGHKPQIVPLIPSPYFHHEINHIDYIS